MRRTTAPDNVANLFVDESLPGTLGTLIEKLYLNDVQESIVQTVIDAGIPLIVDDTLALVTQLSQAIQTHSGRVAVANVTANTQGAVHWNDVLWIGGGGFNKFVALGGDGAGNNDLVTSINGSSWTQRTLAGTQDMLGIADNAAGGTPTIALIVGNAAEGYTSGDAITWTQRTVGAGDLHDVAFGAGLFLATGDHSTNHYSSADGITWVARAKANSAVFNGIHFADSLFVAVGFGGKLETSPDGLTWTSRTSNTSSTLNSVFFAPNGRANGLGLWMAVGQSGALITSPDGITWTLVAGSGLGSANANVVRHMGDRVGWLIGTDLGHIYHGHPNIMVNTAATLTLGANAKHGFASFGLSGLADMSRIVIAGDTNELAYTQFI